MGTKKTTIDSKEFYRLNFILQDSYATTTNNYLSKLIGAINEILKAFFAYMCGDKRKERIRKQYRKKFLSVSEETG